MHDFNILKEELLQFHECENLNIFYVEKDMFKSVHDRFEFCTGRLVIMQ